MRILLVKTSSLGDVANNFPVVGDVLHHCPEAIIDWVVEEGFADIDHSTPESAGRSGGCAPLAQASAGACHLG